MKKATTRPVRRYPTKFPLGAARTGVDAAGARNGGKPDAFLEPTRHREIGEPIQFKQTYQSIVGRRLKARRCPRQHRRRPRAPPTAPIGPTVKALRPPASRSLASRLRGSISPPGSIAASARVIQPNLRRLYRAGEASIVQAVATSYRAPISTARMCSKAASPRRRPHVNPPTIHSFRDLV
jgi:hypothetical protein